jgi:hypothetical protein
MGIGSGNTLIGAWDMWQPVPIGDQHLKHIG